jgi:hypothetical protein
MKSTIVNYRECQKSWRKFCQPLRMSHKSQTFTGSHLEEKNSTLKIMLPNEVNYGCEA